MVKVLSKTKLNHEITRFTLEKPWDFQAGQYTSVAGHYFSIASSPKAETLELDIQDSPLHPLDSEFAQLLATADTLDLTKPAGQAVLQNNDRPLILVAGGSGIAPMKSIAETTTKPFQLYWGVRHPNCFYDIGDVPYTPVVGFVHEAVLKDFADLSAFDIYIAGPFALAFVAREAFLQKGGQKKSIFADAFSFTTED